MRDAHSHRLSSLIASGMLLAAGAGLSIGTAAANDQSAIPSPTSHAASSAESRVNAAVHVVEQMRRDPHLVRLLDQAKGIFIIPHYGKGAAIVGGQGGGGVVLERHASGWGDPAFYSIGGASIGAQVGGEGGAIAMLLMTDKAVNKFANSNATWSLNANAGLTVVTYSGKAQAETGTGDVVVWSDTSGLFGGASVSITDIAPDRNMDHGYYQNRESSGQILASTTPARRAAPLRRALETRVAAR